jgi:hypothetical protein
LGFWVLLQINSNASGCNGRWGFLGETGRPGRGKVSGTCANRKTGKAGNEPLIQRSGSSLLSDSKTGFDLVKVTGEFATLPTTVLRGKVAAPP